MKRFDIINKFIDSRFSNACNYLEIGVADPKICFDLINASKKTSVDPGLLYPDHKIDYNITSDEFFRLLNEGKTEFSKTHLWDIIFIDGLHTADQAYKDIINSLKHINQNNGIIVLHDCSPEHWYEAHSDVEFYYNNKGNSWNGTVWKALYYYRTKGEYLCYTIDTDYGIGIIDVSSLSTPIEHTNKFFEFGEMKKDRNLYLGLVSLDSFLKNY